MFLQRVNVMSLLKQWTTGRITPASDLFHEPIKETTSLSSQDMDATRTLDALEGTRVSLLEGNALPFTLLCMRLVIPSASTTNRADQIVMNM